MNRTDLLKSLIRKNDSKMVLLVMDGLGGLPGPEGMTELEAAVKPNFDSLAQRSELGLLDMVDVGITPGSGPGHPAPGRSRDCHRHSDRGQRRAVCDRGAL